MGKKKRNMKLAADAGGGMPRSVRREILGLCNQLLELCSKRPKGGPDFAEHAEIRDLVERIRKKQHGHVMAHKSREEEMDRFKQWLTENEVDLSFVEIAQCENRGYGLKAKTNIQINDCFLKIPRKLMISTETAKESILGQLMKEDEILHTMSNVALALHLLCEKVNPESKWAAYINILPDSYDTPLYFTVEEMQMLQTSPILPEVLNQYKSIARQYAYFYKLFHGHLDSSKLPIKDFCYDDYRWAVSTVMTRQNQIPNMTGTDMTHALIPMWDLCNHANGKLSTDFNLEKQCSECYAFENVPQGNEVYLFYGARSNCEFFMHSGFVYMESAWDRLPLKLGVSKNDSLFALKAEALTRLGLMTSRTFSLHSGPIPIDCDLIAYLRIFHMTMDELKDRVTGPGSAELLQKTKLLEEIVSDENEIKAWMFLQTRVLLLLKTYQTDITEDEELLRNGNLNSHQKMCVQLRLCEKNILRNTIMYAGMKPKYYRDKLDASQKENIENGVKDGSQQSTKEQSSDVEQLTQKLQDCNTENGNEVLTSGEANVKAQEQVSESNGNMSKTEDSNANSPCESTMVDGQIAEQSAPV